MSGKMPVAVDTEAAVLGSVLLHGGDWWNELVAFTGGNVVDLFYNSSHNQVARVLRDIANNAEIVAINTPVFKDRLVATGMDGERADKLTRDIIQCGSLPDLDSLRAACYELMGYRASRELITTLQDTLEDVYDGGYLSPTAMRTKLEDELHAISYPSAKPPTAAELLEKTESDTLPTWSVPTGLDKLDEMLNGGYASGRLYVLAAGTKVGKTTTAITNIERAISSGAVVIVFSLETIERDFVAKMLANMSQLDRRSMVEPFLACDTPEEALKLLDTWSDDERESFLNARAAFRNSKMYPVFRNDMPQGFDSIIPIIQHVREANPGDPCVVFIDHLNLLTESGTNVKEYKQLDNFTKTLFDVAQKQDVAVVGLMQLNQRGDKGGSPSLESIRGSQSPAHNANTVILLDRDIAGDSEDADVHTLRVKIAANRNGPAGEFEAYFDGAIDYVGNAEVDEEDDEDW